MTKNGRPKRSAKRRVRASRTKNANRQGPKRRKAHYVLSAWGESPLAYEIQRIQRGGHIRGHAL